MRQFYVKNIFVLCESTENHARGDIFAIGSDGYYKYNQKSHEDFDTATDPTCWPNRTKNGIHLYRDYWTYFCELDATPKTAGPYYLEVLSAAKKYLYRDDS